MNRKATVFTVLTICFAFAAFLAIRLLLLSSESGISVSTASRASEEEIMTPGKSRRSEEDIPEVNINTCSADELKKLPGIGSSLADSVISYREENGPFLHPEDIMNVPGIGEGIYEQVKNHITIEEH